MLTLLFTITAAHAADDIVFVGNSYTIGNDLAAKVQQVYADAGDAATASRLAAGGLNLADHASRAADTGSAWHTKLVTEADDREWVVLQDQSQVPGFPVTQPEWVASRDGALALDALISSAGAETVFFLTWGRRDGDAMNEWLFPDFTTMQDLLTAGYGLYAEACSGVERPVWTAPVGPAFAKIHDDIVATGADPTASDSLFYALYSGDGSHPSALGTQLAAYVFYASLTGNTPVGLPVPSGLDADQTATIQEAAESVVFDPADGFEFPWETTETSDTGSPDETEDTGEAHDNGDSGDAEDDAGDSGSAEDNGVVGGSGAVSSAESEKSSGCSAIPSRSTPAMLLVAIFGLIGWRQRRT